MKQDNEDDDKASDDNDSVLSLSLLDDDYDDYDYGDYGGVDTIPPPPRTWSEDDSEDTDTSVLVSPTDEAYMQQWSKEITAYSDRSEVEKLRARQYWRSEWRIQSPECFEQPFNVGNAATLGTKLGPYIVVVISCSFWDRTCLSAYSAYISDCELHVREPVTRILNTHLCLFLF